MEAVKSIQVLGLGEKVKLTKTFRHTCFLMYFSISSIVSFLQLFDLSAPSVVKLTFKIPI